MEGESSAAVLPEIHISGGDGNVRNGMEEHEVPRRQVFLGKLSTASPCRCANAPGTVLRVFHRR